MSRPEAEDLVTGIPRQLRGAAAGAEPRPAPRPSLAARSGDGLADGFTAFTGRALGRYQAAVVRIGFGLVFTLQLLLEWPHRRELYGDRAAWSLDLARQLLREDHAFTVLAWTGDRWWFEAVYHLGILAGVLMVLGWRTRASSVLFLVTVLSLQNRSVLIGDGGDNIVHLMAVYLVFTRSAEVWSLDARRARRHVRATGHDWPGVLVWTVLGGLLAAAQLAGRIGWDGPGGGPDPGWEVFFWTLWGVAGLWYVVNRRRPHGEPRAVLDALANMLHNCALLVIGAQVVLVYATAGWYKVQGARWQDGTALYYPLHLDYFTPWPGLAGWLGSSALLVFAITYGTVLVQVAFPFTLLNRRLKNVLLALMMLEHLGIAVLLGLPVFSLAMIAADAVFLPTGALLWLAERVRTDVRRVRALLLR
ncbi:HTTM domain-containing protein [Kitasatospora sp. NPDC052896]|uniref:HTTM domain-containing protein n=1 Tax=Kitasatospora sp. NPDC052896 TaxID=3364061 RepID=UPI0037CBDEC0